MRGQVMLKLKPDIIDFLSESVLKQRYNPPAFTLSKELQNFCMNSNSSNIYRMFLLNQRYIINCMIVDTVLNNLEPDQAKFILYKYKQNQCLTWISAKLDVPTKTLKSWHNHIKKHIQNMLFYHIETNELFYKQSIINMINILDFRIESVLYGGKMGITINMKWLEGLCHKREFYRKVLEHLTECQARPDDNLYNWVISCKCRYPTLPIGEFTAKAAVNKSTIYRHLNRFSEITRDFYMEISNIHN